MLSLKRFLHASPEEEVLRKVVSLLLEKIGTDAVEGNPAERGAFRAQMRKLRESAKSEVSAEPLLIIAGSAVQAMEDYNHRITALLRRQSGELQCIVSMVTETALKIGGESARSAQRLQEIGNKFEQAGALDDLGALKEHLGDCLHSFREEARRQKAESDAAIGSLQQEIERRHLRTTAATLPDLDPITGLPRQPAGILAMQEASKTGKRLFILVVVVKGIQSVNARYGFEVGDRMLRVFKDNFENQLLRADTLFRWDGPALVVLLDRTESLEQTRAKIRRMLDTPLEATFDVEGRSVLIPISAAWYISSLMPPVAVAVKQIQSFIASQAAGITSP